MRILLSWLREFVEVRESPRELAAALTMAGMAVDTVEDVDGEIVFEFDITSNRPDAMNHFGMAREVAARYGRDLRWPESPCSVSPVAADSRTSVTIEDSDACRRYVGAVFTDVRVQPSPGWMRRRLELCGIRPINSLADLTNYVLLEMGQPTHAFDLDTLAEHRIVVRRARDGETVVTLDGTRRDLSPEHLVICDAIRPVALAGVMGGADTEITAGTRNVLLEAAWFRPAVVRSASRHFKLHTEASHRFERGADRDGTVLAARRIASLLQQSGGGTVLGGLVDCHPRPGKLQAITLRRERIRRILGAEVEDSEVETILRSLGFRPSPGQAGWSVPPVSHRLDVEREIDLIEEIARIHGFDRFPSTLPAVASAPSATRSVTEEARLRSGVRGLGYDETIGFSFSSVKEARKFGGDGGVKLRNPLSRQWAVLRNSSVPTMLRALEWNLRRSRETARLAEFGRTYAQRGEHYDEPRVLTLGACGDVRPASWNEPARPVGFYDLKADVAALLQPFELQDARLGSDGLPGYYRSGHAASLRDGDELVARFGQIDPRLAAQRKMRTPVFVAEIFLEPLYRAGLRLPRHRRLSRMPAVRRDFSLLVPAGVGFGRISAAIGSMPDLVSLEPVEVYHGKKVPQGFYSLLLRASWQRMDQSLTDTEVNGFAAKVRSVLESELGIRLRS